MTQSCFHRCCSSERLNALRTELFLHLNSPISFCANYKQILIWRVSERSPRHKAERPIPSLTSGQSSLSLAKAVFRNLYLSNFPLIFNSSGSPVCDPFERTNAFAFWFVLNSYLLNQLFLKCVLKSQPSYYAVLFFLLSIKILDSHHGGKLLFFYPKTWRSFWSPQLSYHHSTSVCAAIIPYQLQLLLEYEDLPGDHQYGFRQNQPTSDLPAITLHSRSAASDNQVETP